MRSFRRTPASVFEIRFRPQHTSHGDILYSCSLIQSMTSPFASQLSQGSVAPRSGSVGTSSGIDGRFGGGGGGAGGGMGGGLKCPEVYPDLRVEPKSERYSTSGGMAGDRQERSNDEQR